MSLSRRGLLAAGGAGAVPFTVAATPRGRGTRGTGVRTGFDVLAADGYRLLAGQKVGVVTNPTGVTTGQAGTTGATSGVRHIVDLLHADNRVNPVAVFGPEHGFRGTAQAGGSEGRYDDPATGLPVHDTYLKRGQALADVFTASGADTVVFDVQDVGARFYTYIWTLYDCMEAAALAGKRLVVLDRPNPVTGRAALGPVLRREFATFVGREPIAQAHGMTVGELALLFNGEFLAAAPADLEVVRMTGWRRDDFYDATGLPWVPPSPNMPTPDTALVYSGTCLFEGTNLSEGRGTTRPFELLGAEGIDRAWAEAATAEQLPGVHFREAYFAPVFSKFQGRTVGGVQLHVHDRHAFDPVRTAITLLVTAKRVWSGFAWRPDHWIDRLTGSTEVRTLIDAGATPAEITATWQPDLAAFRTVRRTYLRYP
ncbi:exo-beta-N-acetylmuramidase NamZ domain-containing protein [Streptomyces sp. NPDC088554]|uniref:exo-beta-N-acetylmuramidase NamZ family protein n=1 Tax=Streptomyces sp. NPDC088554 TaxID=3365865 RepID=UPI0037F5AF1F